MEENVTPGQIGLKYGMIYALVSTVVNLVPIVTDTATDSNFILPVVNIITAFAIFIIAGRDFKKQNGGMMGFGEGFKINMIAASLTAVIRTLITYIYVKFIDTEYNERVMRALEESWEQSGMPAEQLEQSKRISSMFVNPEVGIAMGIIMAILGGLIWGAISAAITKNEEDEF